MPPANQSSKAALITWTVVATVFGITMAVLALVAYAGRNDADLRAENTRKQYNGIVGEAELQSQLLTDLKSASGGSGTVLNALTIREEELANRTAGTNSFTAANEAAQAALAKVALRTDDGLNANNLTGALDSALTKVDSLKQQNQSLTENLSQAQATVQQVRDQTQQQLAAKDQQVEKARADARETLAKAQTLDKSKQDLVTKVDSAIDTLGENFKETAAQLEQRNRMLDQQKNEARSDLARSQSKNAYQFDATQMTTKPDGIVTRSPANGVLYINLGSQDAVRTGMTFQVYDAVRGIPKMENENDPTLPKGKGSIQIMRVLPTQSECRIVQNTPGQTIRDGDLIANLAYDKNVPVRFRIYGDFDLNNDGKTAPADRERLSSLVQQFGGKVVDDVTVGTDVLVLGQEPEVPSLSAEDRNDPLKVAQQSQKQQQRDAYLEVLRKAQSLSIPVLNQNQFLYYIGYFEEVSR